MEFKTISADEFKEFAKKSPYFSFLQTSEIATLKSEDGWTPCYFGVVKKGRTIAATMLIKKPTFLGKSIYYAPGGPLVDLEDSATATFLLKNLIGYAKKNNGYVLKISPNYELVERDRNGEIVAGGFNHKNALILLKRLGFIEIDDTTQPKYLFVLDVDGKTPDELFRNFKANTRNLIRRAEKMGVTLRELREDELTVFKEITEGTSLRRNFEDKSLAYYKKMYELFGKKNAAKFILAEAKTDQTPIPESKSKSESESESELNPKLEALSHNSSERVAATSGSRDRNLGQSPKTPLSVAMFMLVGNEIVYLFSGNDKKYMHDYNAQYLIQWQMIKYAAENGYKKYNFYGIRSLPNPNSPSNGIYKFKKGFDGQVVELIGSFERPLSPLYYFHRLLASVKHKLKTLSHNSHKATSESICKLDQTTPSATKE